MGEKEREQGVARTIARYASSTIYQRVMGALNAFVKPRLLPPEMYGLWNLLSIITAYVSYLQLGTRSAMRYQIPLARARGDEGRCDAIRWTVLKGTYVLYLPVAAGALAFSFFPGLSVPARVGLAAVALIVMLQCGYEYYMSLLKSDQSFSLITASNYLSSTILLLASVALIPLLGIYGVYLAAIVAFGSVLLFLRSRYSIGVRRPFDMKVFTGLAGVGLPIMLYEFLMNLIVTADRLVIPALLGVEQLGYYAIAGLVFNFLMQVPNASRDVIEPKMMESVEGLEQERFVRDYYLRPLVNVAFYMPFVLGPVFFLFPVLLPLVLPSYVPGTVPTQVISLGGYFYAMTFMARGIIVARGRQTRVMPLLVACLALNVVLNVVMVKAGFGLTGVAAGSTLSYGILFLLVVNFVRKGEGRRLREWISMAAPAVLPLPAMCFTVAILKLTVSGYFQNVYLGALLALAIFTAVMAAVVAVGWRVCGDLERLRLRDFF